MHLGMICWYFAVSRYKRSQEVRSVLPLSKSFPQIKDNVAISDAASVLLPWKIFKIGHLIIYRVHQPGIDQIAAGSKDVSLAAWWKV